MTMTRREHGTAGLPSRVTFAILFRMRTCSILLASVMLLPGAASALGPHEVLVLANDSSVRSVAVAKEFVRLRGVPQQNLVRLRLPAAMTNSLATSPEDFSAWLEAQQVAAIYTDNGFKANEPLAWEYISRMTGGKLELVMTEGDLKVFVVKRPKEDTRRGKR